jgi:hypothetical protein
MRQDNRAILILRINSVANIVGNYRRHRLNVMRMTERTASRIDPRSRLIERSKDVTVRWNIGGDSNELNCGRICVTTSRVDLEVNAATAFIITDARR